MALDKAKLKLSGMVIGVIVVLTILVFAALFISGMAEGTFTIFGFDRPGPSKTFYNSLNLNQDVKPIIGTSSDANKLNPTSNIHVNDGSVTVSWTPRTDLASGVIDPTTGTPVDINNDMGYIITPYINGSAGTSTTNFVIVPGINTSNYKFNTSDLSNIFGISDFSQVSNIAFTVKTFIRATINGSASSMSGAVSPSAAGGIQHFMNFNKPSSNRKITNMKLHNHMHIRGPNSLKNLNTSERLPHHGPKVGVLDSNTTQDDTYFQSPF